VLCRFMAAAAACATAAAAAPANGQCVSGDPSVAITIEASPITSFSRLRPDHRRFGKVEYIGGLVLKSSHLEFGGLSAIRVEADGQHFISLTDQGWWLTGRIVYDRGRPAGIADAKMAAMQGLGAVGRSRKDGHGWFDTESLAERDGFLYVGIERVNRIVRFDFARCGLRARAVEVKDIAQGIAHLPLNKGLEALAAPRTGRYAGTLIAFSERGLNAEGNLKAFLIGAAEEPSLRRRDNAEFSVRRRDNFDISDSAMLPSGDVLLLERRFSWWTGIAMRLRRVAIADIVPGALVDGPDLLFADSLYQIDNMEGLSIHNDADGIVLTLISDDNFSFLQRTVLLQFRLVGEDSAQDRATSVAAGEMRQRADADPGAVNPLVEVTQVQPAPWRPKP
jgi:hypothetical protein